MQTKSKKQFLKQSLFSISISLASAVFCFSCGEGFSKFEGSPEKPIVDSGGNWSNEDCEPEKPKLLDPSAEAVKLNEGLVKDESWFCTLFWFLDTCSVVESNRSSTYNTDFYVSNPKPTCSANTSFHNTHYCKVDEKGNILSGDFLTTAGGDKVTGLLGGCINRPIKEVWAALLNFEAMKPDSVDKYIPTRRNDLEDPENHIFYVIDLRNVKGSIVGDVKWDVRFHHTVVWGTYDSPRQVAINFQRFWGSAFVEKILGGYVLDRVSENVTSFVMRNEVKAAQYGQDELRRDLMTDLRKARNAVPVWINLPESGRATDLDFGNLVAQ